MALGSSAPEILLSVIEVIGQGFQAGELGPGTIVGSAAFNMFVIIAICVWAIPSTEHRKIKHLRVFFVTMTWSVFAYIWLYLILTWSSYGVIEVWEGIVTFLFFPTTVLTAYIADRRLLIYKYLSKKYRMNKRGVIVGGEGEGGAVEMGVQGCNKSGLKVFEEEENEEVKEFEEHRREYIQLLRELRRKNPEKSMEELELMAREEILEKGPKSRAFYRLQATKKLTGGGNLLKKKLEKPEPEKEESKETIRDDVCRIYFNPAHYTVMESVGQFAVTIVRSGDLSHSQVYITVIDDDIFEEDEHFYVRLSNPRYLNQPDAIPPLRAVNGATSQLQLATPSIATVMILDDDHSGVFGFQDVAQEVPESVGEFRLKVVRYSGARGRVIIPFRTLEGSAKHGKDYKHVEGILVFENNENAAFSFLCSPCNAL
ncbi:Sodium/calcium exchanger 3 like protein [Argiope bruennichi]|uniref:Sodium/calcium exchanger 3 like protein n=1 Tax=Argiope bruennichi TaxID=94029 RepID=A0A8T0E3X8_ARGBR|nr:Sodium/calcium exchanger 3 like protein [Argiope bruennichi]